MEFVSVPSERIFRLETKRSIPRVDRAKPERRARLLRVRSVRNRAANATMFRRVPVALRERGKQFRPRRFFPRPYELRNANGGYRSECNPQPARAVSEAGCDKIPGRRCN